MKQFLSIQKKTKTMKKTVKIIAISIMFLQLQGCCPIFNVNCETCDDVQQGAELADLLLDNFESESEENSTTYNIIHTIVNFASSFECPDEVSSATLHEDKLQLVYSETEDFNNAIVVATQNAEVNQITVPNDSYRVSSEVTFEQDGYYVIDNSIDDTNLVEERDESNNTDQNSPGARYKYAPERIIHITKEDIEKSKKNNKTGNNKYISSWNLSIEY